MLPVRANGVRVFDLPAFSASRRLKPDRLSTVRACWLTFLTATSVGPVLAYAAAEFRLERLSASEMPLEPGASGTYRLRIHNIGDASGTAHLGSNPVYPYLDDPNYAFTPSGSAACGQFDTEWADLNGQRAVFVAGPIAAGGILDCSMLVSRGVDSWSDRFLVWMVRDDQGGYVDPTDAASLGTLTDVSVSAHSFAFHVDDEGFAHSTIRLEIRNGGGVPVGGQIAGYCEDHGFRPFVTDGSGDGGCGDSDWSPGCFDWGYGFLIPEIAAGETYRCLIRLQSIEPYDHPLSFPIGVNFWQSEAGNQHALIDTDQGNNTTLLRLEPDGIAVAAPSTTHIGLLILIAFIVGAACAMLRERRMRTPALLAAALSAPFPNAYAQTAPPGVAPANHVVELLVTTAPGAPTPEQIIAYFERPSGAPPLQGLAVENPLSAEFLLSHRADGDFLQRLREHQDSVRAKLERYLLVVYPDGADLERAVGALRADPYVASAQEPIPMDFSSVDLVDFPLSTTRQPAYQT